MGCNLGAQMRAREMAAAAAKKQEKEMVLVKQKADSEFYQNEEAKQMRRQQEMKEMQAFLHEQMVRERHKAFTGNIKCCSVLQKDAKKLSKADHEQMMAIDKLNQELLEKEEAQFNEYANKVIQHAEENGRNTYPLRKAARAGAGGGLGPQFLERGGIRPSYLVQDHTAAQLPSYNGSTTQKVKKDIHGEASSAQRLGFVW
jgi:hypothetical protein